MMTESGVYVILNTTNGKRYVGSAVNLPKRKRDHWERLRGNHHRNRYLQNAWNKYGEECFGFSVLEYWETEFLVSFEQWWMNMLCAEYNIAPVAGNNLGVKHTAESKTNMSAAALGHKHTNETKAKISAAALGHKHTDETKAKMSAAGMGRKHTAEAKAKMSAARMELSPETRAKMSAAGMGRKHTAETRAKLSAAKMGNQNCLGRTHTDETKAKMSAAALGRKHTAETIANMTGTNNHFYGKKHTAKARAKMSAAQRRRWDATRRRSKGKVVFECVN